MPCKPIMLVGCAEDWKAMKKWSSFDKLLKQFKNESIWDFQSIAKDAEIDDVILSEVNTFTAIRWKGCKEFYARMKAEPDYGTICMFRKLNFGDNVTDELIKDYSLSKVFQGGKST